MIIYILFLLLPDNVKKKFLGVRKNVEQKKANRQNQTRPFSVNNRWITFLKTPVGAKHPILLTYHSQKQFSRSKLLFILPRRIQEYGKTPILLFSASVTGLLGKLEYSTLLCCISLHTSYSSDLIQPNKIDMLRLEHFSIRFTLFQSGIK